MAVCCFVLVGSAGTIRGQRVGLDRRMACAARRSAPRVEMQADQHDAAAGSGTQEVRKVVVRLPAKSRQHARVAEQHRHRTELVAMASAASSEEKGKVSINIDLERMGIIPYMFAVIVALFAVKLFKSIGGGTKEKETESERPKAVALTEDEEKELHVYKCGGCGYELWVARGREFKFFGDNYKCPVCDADKTQFWDLNDPTDPRNQEEEENEGAEDDSSTSESGTKQADGGSSTSASNSANDVQDKKPDEPKDKPDPPARGPAT
ncbi:hypothetical protein FVE85_4661 [Porphyridium purpureum]|uniref:Rubredoxin-like domain-containing protein n=1 Tax=Porphyridium purpureum TaxID=35688 RepID=A0A5J4YS59_PORPP|nr:hypothetical protein FVE85_4661 [Porphyridium purpureum]|eukprot:POR7280..scf236_6